MHEQNIRLAVFRKLAESGHEPDGVEVHTGQELSVVRRERAVATNRADLTLEYTLRWLARQRPTIAQVWWMADGRARVALCADGASSARVWTFTEASMQDAVAATKCEQDPQDGAPEIPARRVGSPRIGR